MQTLTSICRLVSESFELPLFLLNGENKIVLATSGLPEQSIRWHGAAFFEKANGPADKIHMCTMMYLEHFFFFHTPGGDIIAGGPCLYEEMNDLSLGGLAGDLDVNQEKLKEYYRHLPVIKRKTFTAAARIAYFMVHGKEGKLEKPLKPAAAEKPELQLSQRKQSLLFHHDSSYEKKLLAAIRKGRKDQVRQLLENGPAKGELGVLSKSSYLRSQKNLAIAAITLATRAAMDGGVEPEAAYTLSDVWIQRLEEMDVAEEVDELMGEAIMSFADRVHRAHTVSLSPAIINCQQWIYRNIYEPITLTELASHVHLSPAYLSSSFKKETGTTLSEWIQQAKVEEAASLLVLSQHDITDICTWLQFSDQSYFTKVFKKHTGLTPAAYRKTKRTV